MIEDYGFGRIVIDGKTYTSDVIIFPERVLDNWWRKEGHNLNIEDLDEVIEFSPTTLVIGTGSSGIMKVKEETQEFLESKGINVIIKKTKEACDILNSLGSDAVGAFHLTC